MSIKRVGLSLVISWVCFSCSQNKPSEQPINGGKSSLPGNIKGVISYKEEEKTKPDVGATVYAVSTTTASNTPTSGDPFKNRYFQAAASADGSYAINNLPADTYTLVFKSQNAPKKLTYYETRFAPLLQPLVNDLPVNNTKATEAQKTRIQEFFKD